MSAKVIRIKDETELVPTKLYPHAHFPFETLNPPQSAVFKVYDKDANFVLACGTSAGKTLSAELIMAHAIREQGKKAIYVAPLRALAQEKVDDWSDPSHHFSDLKISICTGDYVLTAARQKELNKADIIILTNEMVSSRLRNYKSEKSEFLRNVSVACYDEAHILTVPGRGDHMEVALTKLTKMNPDIKVCFLSATMPNVDEISGWVSNLNGKDTYLLESSYRPIKLNTHYESYFDGSRDYDDTEGEKIASALRIIEYYPNDKFLVFAHTKRTGELMKIALNKFGVKAEFHNANLSKEVRNSIEADFKKPVSEGGNRVIIATSSMSWGINTAARRVIILGVHRGMSEVANYDCAQMIGRAGRPRYDTAGDAYYLLPEGKFKYYKDRLQSPDRIESQLLEYVGGKDEKGKEDEDRRHYKTLAFHLVSEIHHRDVKTRDDIHDWYERTLAHHQNQWFDESIVDSVISLLINCGAIKEEDKDYKATPVGTIASMFYYSPFDVSDYKKNFGKAFEKGWEKDDLAVAVALANTDSNRFGIVSKLEREEMGTFSGKVKNQFGIYAVPEPSIKAAFCYWNLMNGRPNSVFNAMMRGFQFDFPRVSQVLQATDTMAAKWNRNAWFQTLKLRIQYGCKAELVDLCRLPAIGTVRSQKLYDNKIRTLSEVARNPDRVKQITNLSQDSVDAIVSEARMLMLRDEM